MSGKRNLKAKKARNKQVIDDCARHVKTWLNIGGEWSNLELIVMAAQKLGVSVRGDIHPNQQIKYFSKLIKKQEQPKKLRAKTGKEFYSSRAWKILRYQALDLYGNQCMCCGAGASGGVKIHVDHIKPRSEFPELAYDLENLQILCEDCNIGKLNQFNTDWKSHMNSIVSEEF